MAWLLAAFFLLSGFAVAVPGDLDAAFDPAFDGTVFDSAEQADGKILVCGSFQTMGGIERPHLARLHPDGTSDHSFGPEVDATVASMAVQKDGRMIIRGFFTRVGGSDRHGLARLNADGTLDSTFIAPGFGNSTSCMVLQADGKIVIGGSFSTAEGAARNYLARLNADGSLDSAFNPEVSDFVTAVAVQADGKVLLGGNFQTVNGNARRHVARLNADGMLDFEFDPIVDSRVTNMAVQADRKIILGGFFTSVDGVGRNYIARLNSNGTLDAAFNPNPDSGVETTALQADGRLILGGFFSSVGGVARHQIARLNPNGTLDGSFNPQADNTVLSVTVQADGKVLLSGYFTSIGGSGRGGFARLVNGPATGALSIPSANRVAWLRGGTSPEVEQVTFELSTDGGNTHSPLGSATRIPGGWEVNALSLPASGEIRARGRSTGGYSNSSSGLVEALTAFGSAAPEIAVEQTPGTDLADGGSANLGGAGVGDNGISRTFTIRNTGSASLTGLTITQDGPHQDMFTVTANPIAPVPVGGSSTFTVRFTPTATGIKTATLHIANNDSDEELFDIVLIGAGTLSSNADLAALTMDAGAFFPAFASGTLSHAATVASRTNAITLTPTGAGSGATITVNGSEVFSGSASAPIELSVGTTIISTVVTAGDGTSTKTYTLTVTRPEPGTGAGDLETGFNPGIGIDSGVIDTVFASAEQTDGKIVIGGAFGRVAGVDRASLARLHPDGSLDRDFHPGSDGHVSCVVVQPDGKIIIGGYFSSVNGQPHDNLARLNPDGTLDTNFNPPGFGGSISCMALQADGKIVVGGRFTTIGSAARNYLARLNADGSLDSAFDPDLNNAVNTMALQADGKLIVGGDFLAVSGVTRTYVARLDADGSLDSTFKPSLDNSVYGIAVQADGKIVFGGFFRNFIGRFNADGTLDLAFKPYVDGPVLGIALQADGRLILGGFFSHIGGTERYFVARLHADGTLDSAFDPRPDGYVHSLTIQADGKVLLGATFSNMGGVQSAGFGRLRNDWATETLTIRNKNRVQWLRGGTSPEVEQVTFEVSVDGGNRYRAAGSGTRIAGGWERSGAKLPPSGEIRVRGRTTGGSGGGMGGSSGMVEKRAAYGNARPEIIVKHASGKKIADGGRRSFGHVAVGDASDLTFTIKNNGTASLTGLKVTTDGPDQAMFTLVNPPVTTVPGGKSTTFALRFAPTGTGEKSAVLHIASNDANENPYEITVTGTGALSRNADLAALSLDRGVLAPTFESAIASYTASVGFNVGAITVTPVRAQSTATITVNGATVDSGGASAPIRLDVGENFLSIVVTAGDGVTTKAYTLAVTRAVQAPGDVDPGFHPDASYAVTTLAIQPDKKVILGGGYLYSVGGIERNGVARLHPDGTLDSAFNPNVTGTIKTSAVQADGKVIVGGEISAVGGVFRIHLARLNANGTLDAAFNPIVDGQVRSVAVQADGKIVIGGYFYNVNDQWRPGGIARLNANGTLDTTFNPSSDGIVETVAVQTDGKVLLGGYFNSIGGTARNHVGRLNANGTLDTDFNPDPDSTVRTLFVQPDGKVILGGDFSNIRGVARNHLARVNPDGTLDGGFNPDPNAAVSSLALQADGKLIFGGEFTSVAGTARNHIARSGADGSLDGGFDPDANDVVRCLAVQADGRVLVGGGSGTFDFGVGGIVRPGVARLFNDPVIQSPSAPTANRVEWRRGGASPEVDQVSFELSTNRGNSYVALGAGTRIAGGWELGGLSLPAGGEIRARGRTPNGGNGSGLVEALAAFGSAAPEIAIEQPAGTNLADGGAKSFGEVAVGDFSNLTFTIRSTGTATLSGLNLVLEGPDAAMFTITAQPAMQLPGGGSTSFTVRVAPTGVGNRTATLRIASNDGDENPFDLTLAATGTLSTNANLASLGLSAGTLAPAFASGTASYSTSVPSYIGKITLTPGAAQSAATITVNGVAVASGSPSAPVHVAVGSNSIAIVVTAGDGVSTRTYTLNVTRAVPRPGDLDADFESDLRESVNSIALQPDGKALVGSAFFGGVGLARLLSDGSGESTATFNPVTAFDGTVYCVAVQADGKILLGGNFSVINGQPRKGIARLHADGTLESTATFNPGTGVAGNAVYAIAVQADGRILIGGDFASVNGQPRNGFARLNADGTVESTATFNPGTGAFSPDTGNNSNVYSVAVQADGKILLGGNFTRLNGQVRNGVARLHADGTLESTATFNPGTGTIEGVAAVAVQADGKILLGGFFTSVNGQPRNQIARLNANGTVESTATFNPGTGANGGVLSLALQANGKLLLCGYFTTVNGQPRNGIARLNSNGTVESIATFHPDLAAGDSAYGLAVQADGRILVGGFFNSISGQTRNYLARLVNDPAVQTLTIPDNTRVQWARGGAAPEVEQVVFELSTDGGNTFSALGAATRIAGGWEKTGLSLPPAGHIRARGRTSGGLSNGSSGLVEQVASFPLGASLQPLRLAQIGDAGATDRDDPDHDGIVTLAEYGLNLPPGIPNGAPFAAGRFAYPEGERLRVFVQRNPDHHDVTVEVQVADHPAGPWTPLATSTLGAPFAGPGYVDGDAATPGVKTVEIRDTVNMKDAPARYIRVEVTR